MLSGKGGIPRHMRKPHTAKSDKAFKRGRLFWCLSKTRSINKEKHQSAASVYKGDCLHVLRSSVFSVHAHPPTWPAGCLFASGRVSEWGVSEPHDLASGNTPPKKIRSKASIFGPFRSQSVPCSPVERRCSTQRRQQSSKGEFSIH